MRAEANRSSDDFEQGSGSPHEPRGHQQQAELPDEVRRLLELSQLEMGAVEIWLFGSRVRGDLHDDSDFDILAIIPVQAVDFTDSGLGDAPMLPGLLSQNPQGEPIALCEPWRMRTVPLMVAPAATPSHPAAPQRQTVGEG